MYKRYLKLPPKSTAKEPRRSVQYNSLWRMDTRLISAYTAHTHGCMLCSMRICMDCSIFRHNACGYSCTWCIQFGHVKHRWPMKSDLSHIRKELGTGPALFYLIFQHFIWLFFHVIIFIISCINIFHCIIFFFPLHFCCTQFHRTLFSSFPAMSISEIYFLQMESLAENVINKTK